MHNVLFVKPASTWRNNCYPSLCLLLFYLVWVRKNTNVWRSFFVNSPRRGKIFWKELLEHGIFQETLQTYACTFISVCGDKNSLRSSQSVLIAKKSQWWSRSHTGLFCLLGRKSNNPLSALWNFFGREWIKIRTNFTNKIMDSKDFQGLKEISRNVQVIFNN